MENENNLDIEHYVSDTDSDNSEYIDLTEYTTSQTTNIYQFHIDNNKLILRCIGKSSHAPDMIIKENFGPNLNLSLYNCLFTDNELKSVESNNLFFPLIKLINMDKVNNSYNVITSLAVKINQELKYDSEIDSWELYYVEDEISDPNIKTYLLEKNINLTNIVEKIIEYSIG